MPAHHGYSPAFRFGLAALPVMACFVASAAGGSQPVTPAESETIAVVPVKRLPTIELVDKDLRPTPAVALTSLSATSVTYIAADGQSQTIDRNKLLAVVPIGWATAAAEPGGITPPSSAQSQAPASVLHLTDGSRIPGEPELANAAPGEDFILWRTNALRISRIKLDLISRIDLAPKAGEPLALTAEADALNASRGDTILLRNGDKLTGFLAGFTSASTTDSDTKPRFSPAVRIEVEKQLTTIPLPRVRAIALSNPPAPSDLPRLWIMPEANPSSTIVPAQRLAIADGQITFQSPWADNQSESLRTEAVAGLLLTPARLKPLADLPTQAQSGLGRRWFEGVRRDPESELLGLDDVVFPGLMSVDWAIPKGAESFVATLVLPDDCRVWGGYGVAVEVLDGSGKVLSVETQPCQLSPEQPSVAVRAAIGAGAQTLRVRMIAGEHGVVQSKLAIRRGVFLMNEKP